MILQEKNFHMVKVYDNVIPSKACKSFIDLFENNESHQEYIDYNGCPCFTQLNLNQLSPNIVRSLIPYLAQVYKQYKNDVRSKYIPPLKELEEFRIKRYYNNGNEKFDEHVDVTDSSSSIRAVAFLFYLNDNDGNTLFPLHNLNIQPVSGRVIVFPPTWEYPHTGLPPKNDSKYIMSTYIHYGKN